MKGAGIPEMRALLTALARTIKAAYQINCFNVSMVPLISSISLLDSISQSVRRTSIISSLVLIASAYFFRRIFFSACILPDKIVPMCFFHSRMVPV